MTKAITAGLIFSLISAIGVSFSLAATAENPNSPRVPAPASEATAPSLDPAIYRQVAQVTWVVGDIDRVVAYWEKLGVKNIQRNGVVRFPSMTYRGKPDPATAKQVTARIGPLQIVWIQPVDGGRYWTDGLRERGDGIRVLSYNVRSTQEFTEQIGYFATKGVATAVEDNWQTSSGRARMVYLDTATGGGGTMLGLIDDPDARIRTEPTAGPANEYPMEKIGHFAWVVNDVKKVDAYYTGLGFKPFSRIDHNVSLDRIYRGQPGTYEMWLGWNRTGTVPLEWVQQISGPDIYVEYAQKHGEGFHHLGVIVKDMDEAVQLMTARGAAPSQSAAWNTPKGKGRAVYLDTDPFGGVTLELIYSPL